MISQGPQRAQPGCLSSLPFDLQMLIKTQLSAGKCDDLFRMCQIQLAEVRCHLQGTLTSKHSSSPDLFSY